jgi:hypothetical protein
MGDQADDFHAIVPRITDDELKPPTATKAAGNGWLYTALIILMGAIVIVLILLAIWQGVKMWKTAATAAPPPPRQKQEPTAHQKIVGGVDDAALDRFIKAGKTTTAPTANQATRDALEGKRDTVIDVGESDGSDFDDDDDRVALAAEMRQDAEEDAAVYVEVDTSMAEPEPEPEPDNICGYVTARGKNRGQRCEKIRYGDGRRCKKHAGKN